jgi:Ca2+-binding EF-hand superfamily protein
LRLKSSDGKTLNENEFLDYYADLNSCVPIEREDFLIDTILRTWGMAYGKDYVSAARVQEIEDILYEKIRQKTETKVSEGKTGKAAFKYFDLADSGECDIENFTRALEKFGCKFSPIEIRTLFDKYDTNQSGTIFVI